MDPSPRTRSTRLSMDLATVLIGQTVVSALGVLPACGVTTGTVMGAASAPEHPRLGALIVVLGFALPGVMIASALLMWVTYLLDWRWLAIAFIVLPWLNFLLLVAAMLELFRRAGSRRP